MKRVGMVIVLVGCQALPQLELKLDASEVSPVVVEGVITVSDTVPYTDVVMALEESNRILEECVMPAFGLNLKTQTCEAPPSTCVCGCNASCGGQ